MVPAVVLFSVLVGVALIGVDRRQVLLDVLQVVSAMVSRATRFVARLTPYGLFAIAATAAGTLDVEQLGRLQIYVLTYVAISLVLSLWVLPGLVAALTPIPAFELLRRTRNPLITAFVAGDLFIVLPSLIDESKALLERHVGNRDASKLPDVIVPASFNFPHSGKLLSISFVLFAGWFADAAVSVADYPQLALSGLVTFFGSLNAAVPFLLDLFRIPADTFQLFLATGVVNARFGTLLAAMHTLTVSLLGACAMAGAVHWQPRALVRYVVVTAAISAAVLGGARVLFQTVLAPQYRKDQVLAQMHLLRAPSEGAVVLRTAPEASAVPGEAVLGAIRARGILRAGFLPGALPYAFTNARDELVGLDIELAHRLASELGVKLELVPVPRDQMAEYLSSGRCDLLMSGIAVTTGRAAEMMFTDSYLDETLALLVRDHDRERFVSWREIGATAADPRGARRSVFHRQAPRAAAAGDVARVHRHRVDAHRVGGSRCDRAARRAGLGLDAAPPRVLGDRTGRRPGEDSARFRRRAVGRRLRQVPEYVDRAQAEGWYARLALQVLGARRERVAEAAAVVDHPRRAALGGMKRGFA